MSIDLQRDFADVLSNLIDDPARGVVVTGEGDVTCAGMDTELVEDPEYHEKYSDEIDELNDQIFDFLQTYSYPTVMAAKGALVGIGFVFSLYCDLVVIGDETHFSLPEVSYGISTADEVPHIAEYVGERAAMEIALRGKPVSPKHAYELGLVNAVVPEDEVDATAKEIIQEIAEFDSDIVREITNAL